MFITPNNWTQTSLARTRFFGFKLALAWLKGQINVSSYAISATEAAAATYSKLCRKGKANMSNYVQAFFSVATSFTISTPVRRLRDASYSNKVWISPYLLDPFQKEKALCERNKEFEEYPIEAATIKTAVTLWLPLQEARSL